MQTAILGAGAMGSFFGGRLALAGHVVSLLDIDEAHMASIRNILMRFFTVPNAKDARKSVFWATTCLDFQQSTHLSQSLKALIGHYACTSISTPSGRHWTPFVSSDNPSSTAASETFAFALCASVTT